MDPSQIKIKKGERTHLRILDSAMKLIAQQGFENLVLTDIAKDAGVTRGCLLQHFEGREKLITEAVSLLAKRGRDFTVQFLEAHQKRFDPVTNYIEATFEWSRQHRSEGVFFVYMLTRAGYDKASLEFIEASFTASRSRLALDILDWFGKSKKRPVTKAEATALAFEVHTQLVGYTCLVPGRSDEEVLKLKETCKKATKALMEGFWKA